MSTQASRLRNLTIPLTILAFLALAALGYFYFYTQQRQEALHARNYRVLNQVTKNILALNETYLNNARNNASRDIDDLRIKALALFNEDIRNANRELAARVVEPVFQDEDLMSRLQRHFTNDRASFTAWMERQYLPRLTKEDVQVDKVGGRFFITRDLCDGDWLREQHELNVLSVRTAFRQPLPDLSAEEVVDRLAAPVDLCSEVTAAVTDLSFAEFETRYKDKLNLNYRLVDADSTERYLLQRSERGWEVVYTGPIDMPGEAGRPLYFQLTRPFDELMTKVLREDVFDEFVVFRKVAGEGGAALYEGVFQTGEENIFSWELEKNMDSLLQRQLVEEARHQISGIPYMIYLQPVFLSQGEELFIAGLVDRERFEREQASIPPLIIIFISVGIVLMLLAFPTLKLSLMSKNETLGVSDMVLSLTTIMMGASLIVLILFNGYRVYIQDAQERRQQLRGLHEEISQTFFNELEAVYRQLHHYDTLRWNHPERLMGKTITGALYRDQLPGEERPDSSGIFPVHYPFFNAVLWATQQEMIGDEVTTALNPTPKVNISGRQYLEQMKAGGGWALPPGEKRSVYVESILTRTTGDQLAVVSTASPRDPESPIVFMSTKLYSLIRPVLPQSYGFCVIDEAGNVLFHADQARNLQENFLEECTNEDFRSAIFSRAEMWAEGDYLGQPHFFYFKPLRNLPLYLITFEDKNYYRGAHAQAITLNLFFALIFMFSMLLFLGLLYFISPSEHTLKQSHYLLDWLRPSKLKTGNYRKLIFMNLAILLLLIFTTRGEGALTTMAMVLMSNLYAFALAFFYLNRNSYREFVWEKQGRYALVLLIVFVLAHILLITVPGVDFRRVVLFELLPLAFLVLILEYIIQRPYDRPTPLNDLVDRIGRLFSRRPNTGQGLATAESVLNNHLSYRLFFISWLLISSIFPAVKFYKISYDFERELLLRRAQVQMGQDLLDRNRWIDQRFASLGPEATVDSLSDLLQRQAIYSGFYFNTEVRFSGADFPADTLSGSIDEDFYRTLISLRPRFNETVRETNRLNYQQSADTLWRWSMDSLGRMNFLNRPGDFLIRSGLPKYTLPESPVFWLVFAGFLLLLYRSVDFHINHLFNQNLLDTRQLIVESNKGVLLATNEDIFLVVPPPPVVSDYRKVLDLKGERAVIDPDTPAAEALPAGGSGERPEVPLLLVEHFDGDLADPEHYSRRMSWLADLKRQFPQKQLVVTSTQSLLPFPAPSRRSSNGNGQAPRWPEVLGKFLKVIYPIEQWHYLNHPTELYRFLEAKPSFPGAGGVYLQIAPAALEPGETEFHFRGHPEIGALIFQQEGGKGQGGHCQLAYTVRGESRCARLVLLRSAPNGVIDVDMLEEQLAVLQGLRRNGEPVHLLATFSPVELVKTYDRALRTATGKTREKLLEQKRKWEVSLLERRKGLVLLESSGDPLLLKLQNRILKETVHGDHLQNMQYELLLQFDETGDYREWDEAALIREIGQRAQLYYQALWSSCSLEEQFMIYDLARDGIVNGKNREAFDQLLRKALIITFGDRATIMNKSFRNFILTVIEPTEARTIISSLQREGDWSQIKKPLGVIVLVVAAFIMFTQKQLINDTLAFLAALGAVIPILQEVIFRISNTQAKVTSLIPFAGRKKGAGEE